MTLAETIARLRDASVRSLDDTHDFYAHTRELWRLAQIESKHGRQFTLKNFATGSIVTQQDLPNLARKYVTRYMASATLQQLVALFEDFLFAFLMEYYSTFPRSLARKELTLAVVLEHSSMESIVWTVAERHLRDLAYQGLDEWFAAVEKIAAIGYPDAATIERLKEAKASRDVVVHNRSIVNKLYIMKSGKAARFEPGDSLKISAAYLRETHSLIRNTLNDMAKAAITKLQN